jgi:hypothetical protein
VREHEDREIWKPVEEFMDEEEERDKQEEEG